jgi:hypothetical protein
MTGQPFRVTLLYWLVLILSAWNGLRLWTALLWREVLTEFSASPSPLVTAISGGMWMLAGLVLAWSIWRKKNWAASLLVGVAAGYSLWYWIERLAWQVPNPNWLFAGIVNLAGMFFILFNAKLMVREEYERKIENRTVD